MIENMGIKEQIEKKPSIVAGAAIGLVAVSLLAILWQLHSHGTPAPKSQRYYSDDDGKSWFAGETSLVPPFDHNGREAVVCHVVNGPQGKKVSYLEKYTDSAHRALSNQPKTNDSDVAPNLGIDFFRSTLVKKPGDPTWVSAASSAGQQIQNDSAQGIPVEP